MRSPASGNPRLDAQSDFMRARRSYHARRIVSWLSRSRPRRPSTLRDVADPLGGVPRLHLIPLDAIVGTLEPTAAFDAHLRPASRHVRARWERVALAHRQGIALPPITVLHGANGYYVLDGRHRVSVARALGLHDIDAWVRGRSRAPGPG